MGCANSGLSESAEAKCIERLIAVGRFPTRVTRLGCALSILCALLCIALQIASIVFRSPLYFIATGIWVGAYLLIINAVLLYLVQQMTPSRLKQSIQIQRLTMLVTLPLILVNALAFYNNRYHPDRYHFAWLNMIMLALGVVVKVPPAIFLWSVLTRCRDEFAQAQLKPLTITTTTATTLATVHSDTIKASS